MSEIIAKLAIGMENPFKKLKQFIQDTRIYKISDKFIYNQSLIYTNLTGGFIIAYIIYES